MWLEPGRGELWFAGETAEAVLLELEARRRELHAEVEGLAAAAADAERQAEETSAAAATAAEAFRPVAHLRNVRRGDPAHLERLTAGAERLDETLRVAAAAAGRLEAPLAERTSSYAEDLRSHAAREGELRGAIGEIDARALAAERLANGRVAEATGEAGALRAEAEALSAQARQAAVDAEAAAERARAAARALTEADPQARRRPTEGVLGQLLAGAERLEETLAVNVERYEGRSRARRG